MRVVRTIAEMQAICRTLHREGKSIGLVPTMGALHAGHISLVRTARTQNDSVVVSIFVNPIQFGPNEDLAKYPRTFEQDCAQLDHEGVDFVFSPGVEEMYPEGTATFVHVDGLSEKLDGRSRPGHFKGVTTVVSKLFHIIPADHAYFGQKDAAQVAVIRKMVRDQNFDIDLMICPIVREKDGLALSSRNAYLDPTQRQQALVLHRALMRVQMLADTGHTDAYYLAEAGRAVIAEEPGAKLDYLEIVDPNTLEPITEIGKGALVAVAAQIGNTRLIDNLVLQAAGNARGPRTS
ncbi:pantothenate synthetase [Candidatus Koribacter versatilis Ellin345]|uniref:Pantothenate synthetase n=1 Tax=Koribacter versatilis (strain Ellin345) TaxID=204669 RepID=PANC_KORVE|nr:pantoate--beta-alanine ligase [Candidatus Koribacter versatilis]Q1IHA8.1 RecName: Full=Pantothenate synthetase; Short=PS; AltName: Full=Pantoate--beta-alanine ligase; AltName: Full=Pantoate-activating enzyme [Candidatus Koribacter versatilis Ellin345]ABF43742.1 pantothenate synthetase [Candidatus Koribacter versatilis Ellin345]